MYLASQKFEKQVQVFFNNEYLPCSIRDDLKYVYKWVTLYKFGNKKVTIMLQFVINTYLLPTSYNVTHL